MVFTTHARAVQDDESDLAAKYVMPLSPDQRRGQPIARIAGPARLLVLERSKTPMTGTRFCRTVASFALGRTRTVIGARGGPIIKGI